MPFHIGGKGKGNSGGGNNKFLPKDYEYKQDSSNGDLQLFYKNQLVARQGEDGSWFKSSVSTGVGSLHLGGNDSGGVAHSISSAGQNIGFKNEFSDSLEKDKLFFYPTWQAVSCDGKTRLPATMRSYGPQVDDNLVNGDPHISDTVLYNFQLLATGDFEVYAVSVILGENYTGKVANVILSNTTGAEIYNTSVNISAAVGDTIKIDYKYPFTTRGNDDLQLRLVKENGDYLRVRAGTTVPSKPYRSLSMAAFTDKPLAAGGGYLPYRCVITNANGDIAVSALQASRAVVSNANGIPVSAGTTTAEVNNISGTNGRNSIVTIEDGDGFVFNDNGSMLQIAASRLWVYISSKFTGAISPLLNTDLPANKTVITSSTGKLTTTSYTANRLLGVNNVGVVTTMSAESPNKVMCWDGNGEFPVSANTTQVDVNSVSSTTTPVTVDIVDADGVVINDGGSMKQANASSFWTYIRAKLTGAVSTVLTSNLTANRNVITDSNGKLAVATYTANRSLVTDSNGYITTGTPAVNEVLYKNSVSAAGTYTVVSDFNGGFTVAFVRTASTIYLTVTHTGIGSRWQQQHNVNAGSPSNNWTSSSGNNFPLNTTSIPSNGGSISGWIFATDGSGQTTCIRVDYNIISNGASIANLYARVS